MKKILCLTSHDLNAPDYGAVLRVRHIFQMLSQFGDVRVVLGSRYQEVLDAAKPSQAGFELVHKIHFKPTDYSFLKRHQNKLNPRFLDIEGFQATERDCEHFRFLMAEHDLVWVHGLETVSRFNIWHWPSTVLDVDDIPSSVYRLRLSQAAVPYDKYWNWRQMMLWRRNEKRLSERFDAVCVCSQLDRKELGGGGKIHVVPNGFDAPQKPPVHAPAHPPQIGFVGMFVYWPNRDGVQWFIENAWPLVREKFPDARLRLAGEGGENLFQGPNIDTLGWVPDMQTEMANWSLAIVPVLAGGGTRIKILESFSRKCPVVSTALGAYGHDVKNGQELLIADNPRDFAEGCIRILTNPAIGQRLAENAWDKFLRNGRWDSQAAHIGEIVAKVASRPALSGYSDAMLDDGMDAEAAKAPKLGMELPGTL